ncbi:MAG TPA: alpha/beta hydrolase [Actinomycetes bacterium]|nr:alpha/beta hydrolase [Actinomycetes bacterium]
MSNPQPVPPGTLFPKDREVRSLDGTPIRYTSRGRGAPAVVLCAGFACPDSHWRYLVPSLRRRGRVLIWDYRGVGASGLPKPVGMRTIRLRREDFRLDRYAEDLEAVLDHARVRRAVLLGHSMGTQVALEGYRRMPDRVAGLVLVAGPYASPFHTMYGSDLGDRLFPLLRHGLPFVPPAVLRLWGPLWRSPLPYPVAALLGSMGEKADPADMDGYFQHMARLDPLVLVKAAEGMHRHSAADVLPEVGVPALVVAGGRDPWTPPALAEQMAEALPDAELHVLEEASHSLPIEEPEALEDLVLGWLAERFPPRRRAPGPSAGPTG